VLSHGVRLASKFRASPERVRQTLGGERVVEFSRAAAGGRVCFNGAAAGKNCDRGGLWR